MLHKNNLIILIMREIYNYVYGKRQKWPRDHVYPIISRLPSAVNAILNAELLLLLRRHSAHLKILGFPMGGAF